MPVSCFVSYVFIFSYNSNTMCFPSCCYCCCCCCCCCQFCSFVTQSLNSLAYKGTPYDHCIEVQEPRGSKDATISSALFAHFLSLSSLKITSDGRTDRHFDVIYELSLTLSWSVSNFVVIGT